MSSFVLLSIIVIAGFGLVAGVVLAVASKYLSVPEDPRIEAITALLPGVNCGGCGLAGCADYANAIVTKNMAVNLCGPGGAECAKNIAAYLGVTTETTAPKTALVHCRGDRTHAKQKFLYNGIADCAAAAAMAGGDKACPYGCLGYGSCARVCPTRAIEVIDGVAVVHAERCIACGRCIATCPRQIIHMVPAEPTLRVFCSSKDKGPVVKHYCKVGCIGCRICTKAAGEAFVVNGFLATRNYAHPCSSDEAAEKCPAKCIAKS